MKCPECLTENSEDSNYCKKCAHPLAESVCVDSVGDTIPCERKQVTVLFSDLSGYTAMTECLDPEEVKAIMSDIFADITGIITKYEGHVERFIGDAVMAVFGMPIAHELDPVRALRATLEIHELVEKISPRYADTIGQPLNMHSGLNTGLVVTGEVDLEKGTHGITGDSVNTAARIQGLAKTNEILVGQETFRRTEGYFNFEARPPCAVKNKSDPLQTYKLLSRKEIPDKVHRISGRRAQLVGREAEMGVLAKAVKRLENGRGSVVSICGDAGTGKSRLVSEFKATLDRQHIQWREGHAYGYTQNIPYYPLINLLSHAFQIKEEDPPSTIREKVEKGVAYVMGAETAIVPYIGSLFSIDYPEIAQVSPEFWKSRLIEAIQSIVLNMAQAKPTVICIEDLHWADASFVELLHDLVAATASRVLFICVYRPTFTMFAETVQDEWVDSYHLIQLEPLSTLNAQQMLKSLLKTDHIPAELNDFLGQKSEGNPFYLEELVNALIDTDILKTEHGRWTLNHDLTETNIPSSIQGVLTARIDRLDKNNKRVLQEASVIGRAFLYKILSKITNTQAPIDQYLKGLEALDLIRTRIFEPDIEYIFKHALTQEAVYEGVLKEDRIKLHERVGLAIEQIFADRLTEYYETLAFHFQRGQSFYKALDYLIKAGEKCLNLYSLKESDAFFQDAFDMISSVSEKTEQDKEILTDVLVKWSLVYYYNGHTDAQYQMLTQYENMVETLKDQSRRGMFKAWMGWTLYMNGKPKQARQYLFEAFKIGEEINNKRVISYALTWLSWCLLDSGEFNQSKQFALKANKLSLLIGPDHYCYFKPLSAISHVCWFTGDWQTCKNIGLQLVKYGEKCTNSRCLVAGNISLGMASVLIGEFDQSIDYFCLAADVSRDPFYYYWSRGQLGTAYLLSHQPEEAVEPVNDSQRYCYDYGVYAWGHFARLFFGLLLIFQGNMSKGLNILEQVNQVCVQYGRIPFIMVAEYFIGKVYLELVLPSNAIRLSELLKNSFFLFKNFPFAATRAEKHLKKAIEIARQIGADQIEGQALIDLGRLLKRKKRMAESIDCFNNAIRLFERYDNQFYIHQATINLPEVT